MSDSTASRLQAAHAAHRAGDLQRAEAVYRAVLADQPDDVDALHLLGLLRFQQDRHAEAVTLLARAVTLQPTFAGALLNLGNALRALGRLDEALDALQRALAARPDYPGALSNLGLTLHGLGRTDEAIAAFERALHVAPDFPHALLNLGATLDALNRCAEAVAPLSRLVRSAPSLAIGHFHLGCALAGAGQGAAARTHLARAVALAPDLIPAWLELGTTAYDAGDFAAARHAYDEALRRRPAFAPARYNLALLTLLEGDLAAGWAGYEWRWQVWQAPRPASGTPWRGEARLAGRSILLNAEQGFGDTLQFVRYVPEVVALGAQVTLAVQQPLLALLRPAAARWKVRLIDQQAEVPACDFHCPLASLPLAFQTRLDTIPDHVPYLAAPRGDDHAAAPARGGAVRLGIVWSGAARPRREHRAIPLAALAPLFALHGVTWTVLQPDVSPADAALLPRWPNVARAALRDFADTAARIEGLDGVVSIDTAVAHLSGALGRPLWLMLPFAPDWRWLKDRATSPWYPHATLVRQAAPGAWTEVVEAVVDGLLQRFPDLRA